MPIAEWNGAVCVLLDQPRCVGIRKAFAVSVAINRRLRLTNANGERTLGGVVPLEISIQCVLERVHAG